MISAPCPLHTLAPDTQATLVAVGGERSFRRRLMELGLLPGTRVRVIRNVDVGGVMELEVRNCRISVRRAEADALLVEVDAPGSASSNGHGS